MSASVDATNHTELPAMSANRVDIHDRLFEKYGPLICGDDLLQVAGFHSADALRMAAKRGALGFALFALPGRRGRFARTEDVASWLSTLDSEHPTT